MPEHHPISPLDLLIVNASRTEAEGLIEIVETHGGKAQWAMDPSGAAKAMMAHAFDVVVIDGQLPDDEAEETLECVGRLRPEAVCLMMVRSPSPERVLVWMRKGASDCLEMPVDVQSFLRLCERLKREKALLHMKSLLEARTRELSACEGNYRALFERAQVALYRTGLTDGKLIEINERYAELAGYPDVASCMAEFNAAAAWAYPEKRVAMVETLSAQGFIRDYEAEVVRKDGVHIWILFSATIYRDLGFIEGSIVDITQRKRAEQMLSESEARFKALHNASFGGIVIHDKGLILDCNQGLADMTGYSLAELIGMNGLLLIAEKDRPLVMKNILDGYEKPYEATGRRKNGEEYPVHLEGRNVPYKGKRARTVEFRDITEQKQAEAEQRKLQGQLIQSRKMESVGRLAGGVAHDFNNMLGVILGHAEIALDQLDSDHPLHGDLEAIVEAARRSADLTRQLLIFARKQIIEPRVVDVNQNVQSIMKMLKRLIGENIELVYRPASALWPVKMDASQLDQILINLCVNARDAIRDVGVITIETGNVTVEHYLEGDQEAIVPGDYVFLTISDNGCGMDQDTLDRLFEPFFTTKKLGKGTGLGLATLYGIVRQNNGFIHVDSIPGKGSVFRIHLPRYRLTGGEAPANGHEIPLEGGHETILLVEDELAILNMVKRMLAQRGYTVLTASTPAEAVVRAKAYDGRIDLLITDVIMPQMNGRDLAVRLGTIHPELKRLFMSGYAADVISNENQLSEGENFIQKPFMTADLTLAVRNALDKA